MPKNCKVSSQTHSLEECTFMHKMYLETLNHFLEALRLLFPFRQFF